jgi:hypothetical protein
MKYLVEYTFTFGKQVHTEEYDKMDSWAAMARFAQLSKQKNVLEVKLLIGSVVKLHHKNEK